MAEKVADLAKQVSAADVEQRVQAAEGLGQLGEEAQEAALALVRACADPEEEVREAATGALESIGVPTNSDVGGLTRLLSDANADVVYWAATLLGRLGATATDAVPALINILANEKLPAARERAAWALGQIGPAAKDAVASLEQIAKLPNPRLARLAQEALDQIRV